MTNMEIKFVRGWMETYKYGVYVHDLCRECLMELKVVYMMELADNGTFSEVMGTMYGSPSCSDIANADELIPDDVIFEHYAGISFVPDDFFCLMEGDEDDV